MTVVVNRIGYLDLNDCDDDALWDTVIDGIDTVDYVEGTGSVYGIMKTAGLEDTGFTPAASKDLSGVKHVRFWGQFAQGTLIDLKVNGGIRFWASDGTNTGYWYVGGRDTYQGGFENFVVDVSAGVDAGTKPTAMNAITSMGITLNLTGTGKNVVNTWLDGFMLCDGVIAYGDDVGGYFDFEDIYLADVGVNLATGTIRKVAGVYFAAGKIVIGDSVSTNGCKFNAKSQSLIFEEKDVASTLYGIEVVDNGTGVTEFILGEKVGSAGVSGCFISVESLTQTPKWDLDGGTDTDVDNFKLYGSTFSGADGMILPATATEVEVLNCNFDSCGQIIVDTCIILNSNFINAIGNAIEISTASHQVEECSFINPTTAGVEITVATTYDFDGLVFVGTSGTGPYDVNNTSGSTVTINVNSGNAQYSTGSTVNFIQAPATVEITVKDIVTTAIIEGARVLVVVSDGVNFPYQESVTITRTAAVAYVTHTGHGLSTGDKVYIQGADQWEYNRVHQITVTGVDAYNYAIVGTPDTPATGTITATMVIVDEDTNVSGIADDTRVYANNQPFIGVVREGDVGPYKASPLTGTIDKTGGYSVIVQLIPDA